MTTLSLPVPLNAFALRLTGWLKAVLRVLAKVGSQDRLCRADHRVMAECLQASGRDLDDEAGLARAWGRFPENLPDGRGNATHLRHI